MTDVLHFTGDAEADALIAREPLALLVGFALDQQVPVPMAFAGPAEAEAAPRRLDAAGIAATDPEPCEAVFRERPAIHRFPGTMAKRVQELCGTRREEYDGDAARVWTGAPPTQRSAAPDRGAARLRRDEGDGARLGAREAVRRRDGRAARPGPPDARGRRLAGGARGVPGGEARATRRRCALRAAGSAGRPHC